LGEYSDELAKAGVPVPNGLEDLNMGIALHPNFRGGGNAAKLIQYYQKHIFEKGAARIRGAILQENSASIKFFKKQGWEFKQLPDSNFSVWIDRPSSG
jgi:RimJ/RimL family protein N-acetyltransferase